MTQERRNYFRLQDRVAIEIRSLEPARALDPAAPLADEGTRRFSLISELEALNAESQSIITAISQRDPSLSRYLRLLERKLKLISEATVDQDDEPLPDNEIEVSLSAGGVSFATTRAVNPGEYLAIRMLLLPQRAGLLLKSRVIGVTRRDGRYQVRCEFINVSDADRTVISRHLMQSESRQRATEKQ